MGSVIKAPRSLAALHVGRGQVEALIAPPTMISGSNAYDDGLRRSCASFKMNEDTSFTLKSATETGKSLFRSLGMVVVLSLIHI